jgi:hypothetical protein
MAAEKRSDFRPNLSIFGVPRLDPGYLYILKAGPRFKIGKTTNPKRRLLAARTWLPEFDLIGVKPFWNVSALERQLFAGLAQFWFSGEWHEFPDDSYDSIFDEFANFYDEDRDMNSVDFIYWMHNFGEILMEYNRRNISLRKWQREAGAG